MQPQHGGTLQDRQVAKAPQSALFDAGAARLASGTHDGVLSAFEMQRKLCGAKHLIDDAKFWEIAKRCEPMEIHEHRALLLGGFAWQDSPSILRDILCWSMSASEPFGIGPRHWPQTWRRAYLFQQKMLSDASHPYGDNRACSHTFYASHVLHTGHHRGNRAQHPTAVWKSNVNRLVGPFAGHRYDQRHHQRQNRSPGSDRRSTPVSA